MFECILFACFSASNSTFYVFRSFHVLLGLRDGPFFASSCMLVWEANIVVGVVDASVS